jgi:hypothetical protein
MSINGQDAELMTGNDVDMIMTQPLVARYIVNRNEYNLVKEMQLVPSKDDTYSLIHRCILANGFYAA